MTLVRGANVAPELSYIFIQKGYTPVHTKWLQIETLKHTFPHFVKEVGMLPTLNREEFGNQERITNQKHLTDWETRKKEIYFLETSKIQKEGNIKN